jgi:hypothetical protein
MLVSGWFCGCRENAGTHIDIVDGPSRCNACGRGTGHYRVEEPPKKLALEKVDDDPSSKALGFDPRALLDDASKRAARITISERQIVIDYAIN